MPRPESITPSAGRCGCNCGQLTNINPKTGKLRRFVRGHQNCQSPVHYLLDAETGCWIWQRSINERGYGKLVSRDTRRPVYAHRYYFEQTYGPIPPGSQVHHRCSRRTCVNPAHLELCTPGEHAALHPDRGRKIPVADHLLLIELASTHSLSQLARRFHVTKGAIARILRQYL